MNNELGIKKFTIATLHFYNKIIDKKLFISFSIFLQFNQRDFY